MSFLSRVKIVANPTDTQLRGAIDQKAIGTYDIDILDFLKLTTDDRTLEYLTTCKDFSGLNEDHIVLPFLQFDAKTGEVTGHEGRHRAARDKFKGKSKITIALYPEPKRREWDEDLSGFNDTLTGQFNSSVSVRIDKTKINKIWQNIRGYDSNSGEKYEGKW